MGRGAARWKHTRCGRSTAGHARWPCGCQQHVHVTSQALNGRQERRLVRIIASRVASDLQLANTPHIVVTEEDEAARRRRLRQKL